MQEKSKESGQMLRQFKKTAFTGMKQGGERAVPTFHSLARTFSLALASVYTGKETARAEHLYV